MDGAGFLAFLCVSVLLTIAPGPDNLFVITQGLTRGKKAAVVTAMGMCCGNSVHTLAAALGISAVMYASAVAFAVVKYAGAAYLLYMAVATLIEKPGGAGKAAPEPMSAGAMFRRGFVMNVLNPKVAIFFLAFLPQFVQKGDPHPALSMVFLGFVFAAQAVVIFGLIGWFSGAIGGYVLENPRLSRLFSLLTAGVLGALGIRLALAER
ncbi:MAG TPA: LysE family translocator [Candidatus Ozemobacteraceae bacterium]|nr:LysE family translocator [Candidatus Ozemobacteraceae bacterium]